MHMQNKTRILPASKHDPQYCAMPSGGIHAKSAVPRSAPNRYRRAHCIFKSGMQVRANTTITFRCKDAGQGIGNHVRHARRVYRIGRE